jgi:hypothetical protein
MARGLVDDVFMRQHVEPARCSACDAAWLDRADA